MVYKDKLKYLNITETRDYIKENATNSKKVQLADLRNRAQKEIDSKSDLYSYDTAIQIEDDYYFEFNFIEKNIELYNNSMTSSYIYSELKKIDSKKSNSVLANVLTSKFGAYMIPLFGSGLFINSSTGNLLLEEVKKIYANNPITKNEIVEKIFSTYAGFNSKHSINRIMDDIVDKYSLEVIPHNHKYNILTNTAALYPEKTVQKILEYFNEKIRKEINLTNMSYEDYLSLSMDDFENNYKEFTKDDAERIAWNSKYFFEFIEIERHFKNTNVRIFKINNQGIYVNKNDLEELENLVKDYELATPISRELGLTFFNPDTAVKNGINCIKYRQMHYIKKTDIERYKTIVNYNKNIKETKSLHSRTKLKIDFYPHKREQHYPNVKELILKFAKNSDGDINNSSSIYRIYTAILDNIKFDLVSNNQSENDKLFCSILNNFEENDKMSKFIITFMNFLRDKEDFKLMSAFHFKEVKEKEPYTQEEFINLLSAMLTIISDEKKITKLYRDWRLSTSFSYVFLHYCLAWRKNDLVENLPMVNLSLISNDITDGESFIKWLEAGNKLSHKQSKHICESLEEETRRLRKKASKNNILLSCIISDALMYEVATLLCINEANRQIFFNDTNIKNRHRNRTRRDRCFLKPYTDSGKVHEQLNQKLDIDITKILNGNFDNIRMNKGFMHLVRDKAEELNLFAYAHVQLLRSHKSDYEQLSETTKIYLNKSIDKGSLLAFSTGTMGSVLYLLKQLIDNNFDFKTINEKIEDIKNLNVTPYQLEKNIQSISNKITTLNNEMKRYFANQGTKENFLKRLLYGQSFSGIEEKTKCLIKIVRDEENVLRISPIDSEKTTPSNKCPLKRRSCIGCDYMIALRYFIYEFESKYNQVLTNLENAKSDLDKEIFIQMINTLYVPLLDDLAIVLGADKVHEIVDLNRFSKLADNY